MGSSEGIGIELLQGDERNDLVAFTTPGERKGRRAQGAKNQSEQQS